MNGAIPEEIRRRISKEEINELPIAEYEGPLFLADDQEKVDEALARLKGETLLGFDTETRPSFAKGVVYPPALIQLASADEVFLFQLNRLTSLEPVTALLENPAITKVGVATGYDIKQLKALSPFEEKGVIDLGVMAGEMGIESQGLRSMAAAFFGLRISKRNRCSNWGKKKLRPNQIRYAATDAWISRRIYLFLQTFTPKT